LYTGIAHRIFPSKAEGKLKFAEEFLGEEFRIVPSIENFC
jgi:hypothetical protein